MAANHLMSYIIVLMNFLSLNQITGQIVNSPIYQTVIISFDGFRASNLDQFINENPNSNFSQFAKSGVKAEFMKPSFPSATFPNHYTLVTGLYPESHGIINNELYDPNYNIKIDLQGGGDASNSRWWNRTEPLWLTAKNQGLKTATLFWVGSDVQNQNADIWYPYNADYPFDSRVNDVINWITKLKISLSFLYFDEPDKTGHSYGQNSTNYASKIRDLDSVFGSFIQKLKDAKVYETTNIIVVSDHGMTTFKDDNTILVQNYLNDTLLIDKNKTVFGIISNIYPNPGYDQELYNKLKLIPNIDVYWKNEIPKEYNYRNNDRIAPIVVISREGYRLLNAPSKRPTGGNHGYNNSLDSMRAIFMAHGPNFKSNVVLSSFENVNIYSLLCELMDVSCHASNGTINPFKNALLSSLPISASIQIHVQSKFIYLTLFSLVFIIKNLFID